MASSLGVGSAKGLIPEYRINQQLEPFLAEHREAMYATAVALSDWLRHLDGCDRLVNGTGGTCDCGLGITLRRLMP